MASRISDEQVVMNTEIVEKMIKTFPIERRAAVVRMFESIGPEFFTAPASSREEYHGCFPGGLCHHTLGVIRQLETICSTLGGQANRWTREELRFLGLVHDLGKVGDEGTPFYLPNQSDWHRSKGMLYETNKDLPYMPTVDRTLFLLQKFGVKLTDEEYLAIRLSDGMYEETNRRYGMKEPDLALLLHWADRWATQLEK